MTNQNKSLTQEYLKSILTYDLETGVFTWRVHKNDGKIAGYFGDGDYVRISIDGKKYYGHRLAFLYVNGKFPDGDVDHKDWSKNNNKWDNLRACTHSQNSANCKKRANNKSGFKGVYWNKPTKKWISNITINRKHQHIGSYTCKKLAAIAYNKKALETFGQFAYLNKIN